MPSLGIHQTGTTGHFNTVIAHQNIRTYVEYRYFHFMKGPFFQLPGCSMTLNEEPVLLSGSKNVIFVLSILAIIEIDYCLHQQRLQEKKKDLLRSFFRTISTSQDHKRIQIFGAKSKGLSVDAFFFFYPPNSPGAVLTRSAFNFLKYCLL